MRDWNVGDENGLNSIPSHLDLIDNDEFLNRDNPKKDKDDVPVVVIVDGGGCG